MVALSLKIGFCLCTISCLHLKHEKVSSSSEFPMPYLILYQNMACPDTRSSHLPQNFARIIGYNRVQRDIYAKSMRWRALTRDHESGAAMSRLMATWRCRVRAAPWLRRAARRRHRQPCGFHRRAGHESGPTPDTKRHEKFLSLTATYRYDWFRELSCPALGGLSCHGALPEADRLTRWNDAWRRPRPTSRCVGTPRIRREAPSGNVPSVRGRASAQNAIVGTYGTVYVESRRC